MRGFLQLIAVSLALGAVGYFASEALFWSFLPADLNPLTLVLTILVYALAGGAGLSVALWAGLGGWQGAFLGGALAGFAVEGAIVATMYDAFPLQLVWTPIAWHALITWLAVMGGGLAAARGRVGRQVLTVTIGGLVAAAWALFWPGERADIPGPGPAAAYLVGTGALAALGLLTVDRMLPGLAPPRWALAVLPGLVIVAFVGMAVIDPRPQRLAWPLMVAATVWAMRRLGRPGTPLLPEGAAPPWRHALFLILPVVTAAVALPLLPVLGGIPTNWIVAAGSGLVGLALWVRLLVLAGRTPVSRPA